MRNACAVLVIASVLLNVTHTFQDGAKIQRQTDVVIAGSIDTLIIEQIEPQKDTPNVPGSEEDIQDLTLTFVQNEQENEVKQSLQRIEEEEDMPEEEEDIELQDMDGEETRQENEDVKIAQEKEDRREEEHREEHREEHYSAEEQTQGKKRSMTEMSAEEEDTSSSHRTYNNHAIPWLSVLILVFILIFLIYRYIYAAKAHKKFKTGTSEYDPLVNPKCEIDLVHLQPCEFGLMDDDAYELLS